MMIQIGEIAVEILPCPFCGGDPNIATFIGETGMKGYAVPPSVALVCSKCEASTKHATIITNHKYDKFESAVEAIQLWNMRI